MTLRSIPELVAPRLNWRAYRRLIRWPSLLFVTLVYGFNAYTVPPLLIDVRHALPDAPLLAAVGKGAVYSAAAWPDLRIFLTLALAGPVLLGFALSYIVRASLQWRHGLLLPGARRQLLACHGVVLGIAAVGFTLLARRWDPATPAYAVFGLAAAALSFSLPEGNSRARRAQLATLAAVGLFLLAAWFAPELRRAAQSAPLAVGTAALGLAAYFVGASGSRHTLRTAGNAPLAGHLGNELHGYETAQRQWAQERWRDPKFLGRPWRHGPVGPSAWSWVRVAWYERYGPYTLRRFTTQALALLGVVALGLLATLAAIGGLKSPAFAVRDAARMVSSLICEPAQVAYPLGYILAMMATVFFLVGTLVTPLPRWDHLYVLSRVRRARWIQLSSAAHLALLLLAFTGLGLFIAWAASLAAGVAFQLAGPPVFLRAMLGTLPFVPLWQWYALAELTRPALLTKALAVIGLIGALMLGVVAAVVPGSFLAVLPWLALGVAASQGLYFWSVRALLRRVDLKAQN